MFLPLLPLAQILKRGMTFTPQINLRVFCLRFYNIKYLALLKSAYNSFSNAFLKLAMFFFSREAASASASLGDLPEVSMRRVGTPMDGCLTEYAAFLTLSSLYSSFRMALQRVESSPAISMTSLFFTSSTTFISIV